jgi:hypothetical protein
VRAGLAYLSTTIQTAHVVVQEGRERGTETDLAVHLRFVYLGRPAQDALSFSFQTLEDALPVVTVPALQTQRGLVVETNTADRCSFGV